MKHIKSGKLNKIIFAAFVLTAILYFALILLVGMEKERHESLRDDPVTIMEEKPEDLDKTEEVIEDYAGVVQTYTFTLPEDLAESDSLSVWLVHRYVEIYLDDELVYQAKEPPGVHWGRTPGCYWAFVPLDHTDESHQVRIVSIPAYKSVVHREPEIYISVRNVLFEKRFLREWPILFFSFFCVVTGAIFTVLSLLIRLDHGKKMEMLYLGLTTMAFGLWRFFDSTLLPILFVDVSKLFTYISIISEILISFLVLRYLWYQWEQARIYDVMSKIMAGICLILFLLQLLQVRDLRNDFAAILAMLVIVIVVVTVQSVRKLPRNIRGESMQRYRYLYLSICVGGAIDIVIYLITGTSLRNSFALMFTLLHGIIQGIQLLHEAIEQKDILTQKEKELEESKIALLMSQIKPHFVYNTMNTIYNLCDKDTEQAKKAIHDFSRYLRINFESVENTGPVSFSTELQHVQFYLSIEQMRFGEELQVEYDIQCEDFLIPALTVQPLAENAVQHGLRKKKGMGALKIQTRETEDAYEVITIDDGAGFDEKIKDASDDDKHLGIVNVRKRLEQMCGGTLEITSKVGEGTKAVIRLPKNFRG